MFGFLKKKIKETSEKIAEEIEEDSITISEEEVSEEEKEVLEKEKKGFFKKLFSKKKKEEIDAEEEVIESEEPISEEKEEVVEEQIIEEKKEIIKKPVEKIKEEITEKQVEEKKEVKEKVKKEKVIEQPKEEIIEDHIIKKEEAVIEEEQQIIDKKPEQVEEVIDIPEEKPTEEIIEHPTIEKIPEKEEIIETPKEKKIFGIFKKKEKKVEEVSEKEEIIDIPEEKIQDPTKKKKGILKKLGEKITKLNITDEKFEELFWDLEVVLMENNVAVEVIEKIKENLKQELESIKITRRTIDEIILNNLKETIESLFDYESIDLIEKIKSSEKPYTILLLGVNGSGKTTTIAKLIKYFQDNNLTTVVSASDTFRAAAIQQIEEHTNNLNTKLIKHDYGADPAAVAYDTIEHAKAKKTDVIMIDTAGRLHSNSNLMQELNKISRVANPDLKIFIGESITGNDCVEQAKEFNKSIGIDGIILTKADVDEKGGAAISISYVTGKPILFITTGQEYKDLKKFDSKEIIDSIFA